MDGHGVSGLRPMIRAARPFTGELEIKNVVEVIESGMLASGEWVRRFEDEFARYTGTEYAVATTSGTTALDIALKALGIKSGDEVIVPDLTFIATANAVLFQDAKPVPVDVDEKTFSLDPGDVLRKINPRTKAIIGVHLYGHPFDAGEILDICRDYNIFLVEDCAQAHGAEYKGQKAGSFGVIGCFSFYATKNMTTGEGGMVTTSDKEIERRLRLIINHGQSEKYLHTCLGYNYRMTNIQAAIGLAQLDRLDELNGRRIFNAEYLNRQIKVSGLELPYREERVKHVYHQYVVKIKNDFPMKRDEFIRYLSDKGIESAIHYPLPVHSQPLYRKFAYKGECPNATKLSEAILSLPVHPALSVDDLSYICDAINEVG